MSDVGRIGEQHTAYRRGLVLGLTMAEVGILLIFVLLLLIARSALKLQERNRDFLGKETVPMERLRDLEIAESSLRAITEALGVPPDAPPEVVMELVRVVQENAASANAKDSLSVARDALREIRQARDEIQRVATSAAASSGADIAKLVERQSFELGNKDGQLKYAERRLSDLGLGKGERPCWVEPNGSVVFLYDVVLTSVGIRMRPRAELLERSKFADLPVPSVDPATVLTEGEFLSETRAIYEYGQRDENQCRFHVFVYDGTNPSEKILYKQLLRTVEGHFYKQYKVADGIPF